MDTGWLFGLIDPFDLEMILRIGLAFAAGAVIGYEREVVHRPAGLRTHMLVAAGSAAFTLASLTGFSGPANDPARVAAQIVSGIGFLGAGTIFRTENAVRGLTTAASVWLVAAIGMLMGTGSYVVAVVTTLAGFVVLRWARPPSRRRPALRRYGEPSLVSDDEPESD
jgi:putative Mg2+ transporter-C (MgtC) family protein